MSEKPESFFKDGKRLDGRTPYELRPIKIEVGPLGRANGSCYLEMGGNKVMAAVYGPREVHPRHTMESTRAIVRYRYNMASFSVEDRKRPGPDRRSVEISKVSREALEPMVIVEEYPQSAIDVFVEVLQAAAGTRVAALNAGSIALADAGIPMRGLVAATAVGKIDDTLVLDLNKDEDNYGQADMPVAMAFHHYEDRVESEISLLQMDGHFTQEEFSEAMEMARKGCEKMYEIQREALKAKYSESVPSVVEAGGEAIEE